MTTNLNLPDALRLLRVHHDLTQVDLAKKLEISKSYLSEIESGRKRPTLKLLQRYSQVFSIPVSSILFFSENLENPAETASISPKVLAILTLLNVQNKP